MSKLDRLQCCSKVCKWTGLRSELVDKDNNSSGWVEHACPKCGKFEFYELQQPVKNERVDHANALIKLIATHGRKFFNHKGVIASLEIDTAGKVWFIDEYTRRRIYTHYPNKWKGFTNGGTMRRLIEAMRDYIKKGEQLHTGFICPVHDTFGNVWGYDEDEAIKLRAAALELPIIKK